MCQCVSNIAKHAWSFDHRIDFGNSTVIDKGSFCVRKTLEAWHTSASTLTIILSRSQTSIVLFFLTIVP